MSQMTRAEHNTATLRRYCDESAVAALSGRLMTCHELAEVAGVGDLAYGICGEQVPVAVAKDLIPEGKDAEGAHEYRFA